MHTDRHWWLHPNKQQQQNDIYHHPNEIRKKSCNQIEKKKLELIFLSFFLSFAVVECQVKSSQSVSLYVLYFNCMCILALSFFSISIFKIVCAICVFVCVWTIRFPIDPSFDNVCFFFSRLSSLLVFCSSENFQCLSISFFFLFD